MTHHYGSSLYLPVEDPVGSTPSVSSWSVASYLYPLMLTGAHLDGSTRNARYGEGFDYDGATPSYWLLEMSGVPHGLNADMLRYSGMTPKHFTGMLVASSNRWQASLSEGPSNDPFDPRSLWKLWDSFNVDTSIMYRDINDSPTSCLVNSRTLLLS